MLPLESRHVLVCLHYGIGDVVMELPVLDALREELPAATITVLANPPAGELLEGDPRVDRIVATSRWRIAHRWDTGDASTRREIAEWVASESFDLVLDASHAPLAVGEAIWSVGIRSLEGSVSAEKAVIAEGGSGVDAIRAGAADGWGLSVPPRRPRLHVRPADREFADDLLGRHGLGGGRPIGLSPVASHGLKRWPVERFAALADELVRERGRSVLVFDGPDDDAGDALLRAMRTPDRALRVGPHHLLRTAALLERCAAFACNDTGLMHIAAAVGTKTVGVFGATRAEVFLPRGETTAAASPSGVECGYRQTRSLLPPACWMQGRCLIAGVGCIHHTRLQDVSRVLRELLDQDAPPPARASRRSRREVVRLQ